MADHKNAVTIANGIFIKLRPRKYLFFGFPADPYVLVLTFKFLEQPGCKK